MGAMSANLRNAVRVYMQKKSSQGPLRNLPGGMGLKNFLIFLERNERAGIIYHREGIIGDYDDFDDLEELIDFIRTGKKDEKAHIPYLDYAGAPK